VNGYKQIMMFRVASRQKDKSVAVISGGSAICFGDPLPQANAEMNALIQSMKNGIQKLTSDNQELSSEIKKLKFENIVLQEKYDLLTYKRFVRSSEQETGNTAQQSLFDEDAGKTETETPEEPEKETITYTRKKNAGRKSIPAEISRGATAGASGTFNLPFGKRTGCITC
jgi:hypothetical protein